MTMGASQWLAVSSSFIVFVGFFFGALFVLLPMIWQQVVSLFGELPRMIDQGRTWLEVLPLEYPTLITEQQISTYLGLAQEEMATITQSVVTFSLASIPLLLTFLIYVVLVPLLVYFFLKDRELILGWLGGFLPHERPLLSRIWVEMNEQSKKPSAINSPVCLLIMVCFVCTKAIR